MKPLDAIPPDDWVDARLEAYMDGDLPPDELAAFERALAASDAWRAQHDLAARIQSTLRTTTPAEASPRLTRAILQRARRERWREWRRDARTAIALRLRAAWQPAVALAGIALLATVVLLYPNGPAQPPAQEASVEQALADVKWTLGYVSKAGRKAGDSVQDAIAPLRREPSER